MRSTIFIPQQLIFYTLNSASIDARTYTYICYAQTWNLLNPRIALLIPKIPGLADNPRIAHAQTWNLLNPRIVLLVPKIPGLGMYPKI